MPNLTTLIGCSKSRGFFEPIRVIYLNIATLNLLMTLDADLILVVGKLFFCGLLRDGQRIEIPNRCREKKIDVYLQWTSARL